MGPVVAKTLTERGYAVETLNNSHTQAHRKSTYYVVKHTFLDNPLRRTKVQWGKPTLMDHEYLPSSFPPMAIGFIVLCRKKLTLTRQGETLSVALVVDGKAYVNGLVCM